MDTHPARGEKRVRSLVWSILCGTILGLSFFAPTSADQPSEHRLLAFNPISIAMNAGAVALLPQRTSILLMGVDNTSTKIKEALTRSDTTILCTCDPQTKKASLVSIPRDSRVAIPGHGNGKINSAHAYGGPKLAMKTVSSAFKIPVDHYVVIDTSAMRSLFNMIGPLEVDVDQRMHYTDNSGKLHIDLKPGRQWLSSDQVEQYVRFRHTPEADIGRIRRQQQVLMLTFKKISEPQFVVTHLPQLIAMFSHCVKTDLSVEQLGQFALFGLGLQDKDISMASIPGHPAIIQRTSYWIVNSDQAKALLDRLQGRAPKT